MHKTTHLRILGAFLVLTHGLAIAQHPIVDNLSFDRFKENIESLTEFGDRYSPSDRNRDSVDWLEQELEALGYAVERATYDPGGSYAWDNIWVTHVGTSHPEKMYFVSAHIDGKGNGQAADDDASGVSLVLEIATVMAQQKLESAYSVRFAFWNTEEFGLQGAQRYVEDRFDLQGIENPPGSGAYPEPTWLGLIQHDMILFDHGLPPTPEQSPDADLDIEYHARDKNTGPGSLRLAQKVLAANQQYASEYPAEIGDDHCCTDSAIFNDYIPAISIRENERVAEIGEGSNPHWHQSTDNFDTYSEADFRLGFNAVQTTAGALVELVHIDKLLFASSFD